jgi:hypothetical protein
MAETAAAGGGHVVGGRRSRHRAGAGDGHAARSPAVRDGRAADKLAEDREVTTVDLHFDGAWGVALYRVYSRDGRHWVEVTPGD